MSIFYSTVITDLLLVSKGCGHIMSLMRVMLFKMDILSNSENMLLHSEPLMSQKLWASNARNKTVLFENKT